MTVLDGGIMVVGPGGAADGTTIDWGGLQVIDETLGGGFAANVIVTNTTIALGGEQEVRAGEADNTDISGYQHRRPIRR
jgi:autotransporter passenger strand-loop-strand repeat protein